MSKMNEMNENSSNMIHQPIIMAALLKEIINDISIGPSLIITVIIMAQQ